MDTLFTKCFHRILFMVMFRAIPLKIKLVFLYFFILNAILVAQKEVAISGVVLDSAFKPISHAAIYVENGFRGTISNDKGEFRLKIDKGIIGYVVASHLGYQNARIKIDTVNIFHRFVLNEKVNSLDDINVKPLKAKDIFDKAIEEVPTNYHSGYFNMQTFFREKLYIDDSLTYFSEVLFSVERNYSKNKNDKYYVVKNRSFRFQVDSNIQARLIGGQIHDFLKHDYRRKLYKYHNLKYDSLVGYDGRNVYVISVHPKNKDIEQSITGTFYIDTKTYAFLNIDLKYDYSDTINLKERHKYYSAKYRFIKGKCYPFSYSSNGIKYVKDKGVIHKLNNYWDCIVTNISEIKQAKNNSYVKFNSGNLLEHFTDNYDTLYWAKFNSILPDKEVADKLLKLEKSAKNAKTNKIVDKPEKEYKTYKELYHPNIALYFSSELFKDVDILSKNLLTVNSLVNYYAKQGQKKHKIIGLLNFAYNLFVSIPFQSVESERQLLSKNNLKAKYSPTMVNNYLRSYCYGLDNESINRFKSDSYIDFIRLHTIRKDANYISYNLIEENIAVADLGNKKVAHDYFTTYFLELFLRRFIFGVYFMPYSKSFSNIGTVSKRKKADIEDIPISYVKYLFNPDSKFVNNLTNSDLSDNEVTYLKRISLFSYLNWISPQMFGIKPWNLTKNLRCTFSVSYLLTPFGEMFEQNFWLYPKSKLAKLSLRQYINYNNIGYGLGLKLFNNPTKHSYLTTEISYWQQPEKLMFYDKDFFSGFGLNQFLELKLKEDMVNHDGDIYFSLGYSFKTKGYVPIHLNIEKSFSFFLGFKYNFNK